MDRSPFELGSLFGDLLGWCLVCFLPVFAMIGPLRRDQQAAQAYLLAALLHVAAAAIYIYVPEVLPIRNDSHVFHRYAALQPVTADSSFGIGSIFFKEYLAYVYRFVGPSYLFASVLSIYAFALSVVVLVRFMEVLGVHRGKGLVILLFGALPTAVLYGSVPLREPYQVLFFMLACYGVLRFRLTNQPQHLIAAMIFALLMGLLHKGLILYAPFLIVIMLLVRVDHDLARGRSRRRTYFHRFVAVPLAIGFVAAMPFAAQELEGTGGTQVLSAATTGDGLVAFTEEHRSERHISRGRTAYGVTLDTSSPARFAYSFSLIVVHYMLTPFPWQVRTIMDVAAFGEAMMRIMLLVSIFRMWRRGGPVHPSVVSLLMAVYVSMTFMWAAGTFNYGTATRHHMVNQWILLLLGVPALLHMVKGARHSHPDGPGVRSPERQPSAVPRASGVPVRTFLKAALDPPRLQAGNQPRRLRVINVGPPPVSCRPPRRLTGA